MKKRGSRTATKTYVLSRSVKTLYKNRGKDKCYRVACGKELFEGELVTRTFNGSNFHIWHPACYDKSVINID